MYRPLECKVCGKVLGTFHGYEQGSVYRAHLKDHHPEIMAQALDLKKKVHEFKTRFGSHSISLI